jgi:chromosome segregation ATPase
VIRELKTRSLTAFCALAALAMLAHGAPAAAQKIVCWKDSAGKVIGCGDKVPPEYQNSATKELDKRGLTRGSTESAQESSQRRQREQEVARVKADEDRAQVNQKRLDTALLESYSNEKEIDLKRDRDLQVLDGQLEQLTASQKNVTQRYNEVKGRADGVQKAGKPLGKPLAEELARATADKQRVEQAIEAKQKEKKDLRLRFAAYRKRYSELRGGVVPGTPLSQTTAASQSPVAAKK